MNPFKQALGQMEKQRTQKAKEHLLDARAELDKEKKEQDTNLIYYSLALYCQKTFSLFTYLESDQIYIYKDGIYIERGERILSKHLQETLQKYCISSLVREVLASIKRSTYKNRDEVKEDPNRICLANGILDIKTFQVTPHTPELIFLNKLPVKYDPKAKCPTIETFLSQTLNPDDIPVAQELAGYCLLKAYPIHKAFMLTGTGSNGKSTFIHVLKKFLGENNCASEPLHQLETNRFAPVSLYGKLANLFADLSSKALTETSMFKMLTGGVDPCPAENKFRDRFTYVNYAKMIFSCNRIPRSPDDTDAFHRRWVRLPFPNQFLGKTADKKLTQKLTTDAELSGFLNFALTGLQQLLKEGEFSNSKSVDEMREEYIRQSDSVQAFIMDCIDMSPDEHTEKEVLYAEYTEYCRKMTYPCEANNTFHKVLRKLVRIEDYRPQLMVDDKKQRVQCWKGIVLKNRDDATDPVKDECVTPVRDVRAKPNLITEFINALKDNFSSTNCTKNCDLAYEWLDKMGLSAQAAIAFIDDLKSNGDIFEMPTGNFIRSG